MKPYVPFFTCQHCGVEIQAQVLPGTTYGGLAHGSMPMCSCPESLKAQEREHRLIMEKRKKNKRGRR